MNNFDYYNPVHVLFGGDVIEKVGEVSTEFGKKAVIVSYTDVSFYGELFTKIKASLKTSGVEFMEFFGVTANPTLKQAKEGIKLCKEFGAEVVIGVGGGSVMDCAKVIAAGVLYDGEITKMINFSHSDGSAVAPKAALPTIMIPTLPATGSEMNPTAVITDELTHKKSYVWAPNCLYPKYALVDPSLSVTLPAYQTACGALDTIAHVLEGYFNGDKNLNIDLQDRMQEGVIKTVLDNLPKVLNNPNDVQTRGVMQWASAIGLNGWVLSGTYGWAPMHQMGHVLGGKYNITHGATLSIMIIAWMKFFEKRSDNDRYEQFANRIFNKSLKDAIVEFESFMQSVGVQTRISEFGIKEEDIQRAC